MIPLFLLTETIGWEDRRTCLKGLRSSVDPRNFPDEEQPTNRLPKEAEEGTCGGGGDGASWSLLTEQSCKQNATREDHKAG